MKKYLLALLLISSFYACNKYEDGPAISFRSAEKRLTGQWQVTTVLFNTTDLSAAFLANHFDLYPFSIYSDWNKQYFIGIAETNGNVIAKSNLNISKHKDRLTFGMLAQESYRTVAAQLFSFIPPLCAENEWQITRLKNDELWIKTRFDTNNFEIKFKLISDYSTY
ncbi:MAG: hypothetical protein WCQ95_13360 [Bacteroidota bacterium]